MDIGTLVFGITGIVIGLLGAVPIILRFRMYWEMLLHSISKDELIYDTWEITFDIKSKEEIKIFQTIKIRLKKNRPTLRLVHHNAFGETKRIKTRVDNQLVENSFYTEGDNEIMEYTITSRKAGESIILEDEFLCNLHSDMADLNEDGCNTSFLPYRCKYLRLQIIFPKNFIPSDIGFKELVPKDGGLEEKIHKSKTRHLCCVANNRKQIEWMVDYPKLGHKYSIDWLWKPK